MRRRLPGLYLEDKDASIAVHFRRVPDALRAAAETLRRALRRAVSRKRPGATAARATRPRVPAQRRIGTRARRRAGSSRDVEARFGKPAWVVFVGDDVTDEDAFAAIERGVGVLVGRRETAARYQLDSTRRSHGAPCLACRRSIIGGESMTAAELVSALGDRLKNTQLIIVANREPYIHVRQTREARGLWARLRAQAQHRGDHLDAAGERPRHGARPGHAGVGRHVGGARQRQRRPRGDATQGPRARCRPTSPPTRCGACG